MANEIYHTTNWGCTENNSNWGSIYADYQVLAMLPKPQNK